EAAGRAPLRPEDDADQRRQYAAALVDASQGRVGDGRPRRPPHRQSVEAEDAPLDELTMTTMTDLATLERDIVARVAGAPDDQALEAERVAALGRKGAVSDLLKGL